MIGQVEVIVPQPYGSLFFASAPVFESQLPRIEGTTRSSVVILTLRGTERIGLAFVEVLSRCAHDLLENESSPRVVVTNEAVVAGMAAGGLVSEIGEGAIYRGTIGAVIRCVRRTPTRRGGSPNATDRRLTSARSPKRSTFRAPLRPGGGVSLVLAALANSRVLAIGVGSHAAASEESVESIVRHRAPRLAACVSSRARSRSDSEKSIGSA